MKIIHRIWLQSSTQVPEKYNVNLQSALHHNPGYKQVIWDDAKIIPLVKEHFPHLLKIYQGYQWWVQRCDFARYLLLYLYGGFYLDMDVEVVGSFDPIVEKSKPFFVRHEKMLHCLSYDSLHINNNFLYSPYPKHPFFKYLVECTECSFERRFFDLKIYYIVRSTGPFFLINCIKQYLENHHLELHNFAYIIVDEERDVYIEDKCDQSWMKSGRLDTQDYLFIMFIIMLLITIAKIILLI